MRCSTASFLDQLFILIINQTLISLSEQVAIWLRNFVLFAVHFIWQPTKHVVYSAVHVGGRTVLVCVTAPCAVGTQAANISALPLPALSEIFILSGLPGLRQPHVTLFILQMCEHADCVTVPIRDNQWLEWLFRWLLAGRIHRLAL
jgi:hypothetical protein